MKPLSKFSLVLICFLPLLANGQINFWSNTIDAFSTPSSNALGGNHNFYNSLSCTAVGGFHRFGDVGLNAGPTGCFSAGYSNFVHTWANASIALGDHCEVWGWQSFAAGNYVRAFGDYCFAMGRYSDAKNESFAFGMGNERGSMLNDVKHSFGVGFNKTCPTFWVLPATDDQPEGSVGIGTSDTKGHMLAVKGDIIAEKVQVALYSTWPDYVFDSNYSRMSIEELDNFIKQNSHLPGLPSAETIEKNGYDLSEMDAKLLEKIEELTLYVIDLKKENEKLNNELESLIKQ